MSRCCCRKQVMPVPQVAPRSNCVCDFPTLIILILIVLQFSRKNKGCDDDYNEGGRGCGNQQIGNGILFIVALFFLSCAGCGRGNAY